MFARLGHFSRPKTTFQSRVFSFSCGFEQTKKGFESVCFTPAKRNKASPSQLLSTFYTQKRLSPRKERKNHALGWGRKTPAIISDQVFKSEDATFFPLNNRAWVSESLLEFLARSLLMTVSRSHTARSKNSTISFFPSISLELFSHFLLLLPAFLFKCDGGYRCWFVASAKFLISIAKFQKC